KDFIEGLVNRPYNEIKPKIKEILSREIIKLIKSERAKDLIINSIGEELISEETYNKIDRGLNKLLDNFLSSEELKIGIEGKVQKELERLSGDERQLIDIIPNNIMKEINKYLDENIEEIVNYMVKIIEKPEVEHKLKNSISHIVSENVSRLITSFIPLESISEKVYTAIENYLKDLNTHNDTILIIKYLLDEIMEKKASDLAPEIVSKIDGKSLSEYIISYGLRQENKNFILNLVGDKIRALDKGSLIKDLSAEYNK